MQILAFFADFSLVFFKKWFPDALKEFEQISKDFVDQKNENIITFLFFAFAVVELFSDALGFFCFFYFLSSLVSANMERFF